MGGPNLRGARAEGGRDRGACERASARIAVVLAIGCAPDARSARQQAAGTSVPTIGEERGLAPSALVPYAGGLPARVAVASYDAGWLAVWRDSRGVYATRVDRDGAVVDRPAVAISATGAVEGQPDVAFDGEAFLVVWAERDGQTAIDSQLRAARVSPDGEVLDPAGITLAEGLIREPQVAFTRGRYAVVWEQGYTHQSDVVALRLSTAGTPLDPEPLLVGQGDHPAIAASASRFLIAWRDHARFLDPELGLAPDTLAIDSHDRVRVASDGDGFLLGWLDPSSNGLFATVVDSSGEVLRAAMEMFPGESVNRPQVAFDGVHYVATWIGRGNTAFARLTTAGDPVDLQGNVLATADGQAWDPGLGAAGGRALIVEVECGPGCMAFGHVVEDGTALEPARVPLCYASEAQTAPAVAVGPSGALLVWREHDPDGSSLRALALERDGSPDTAGVQILADAPWVGEPQLAYGGGVFLAAWCDHAAGDQVRAVRLDGEGKPIDAAPMVLGTCEEGTLSIAAGTDGFLVAWVQTGRTEIAGVQVAVDGRLSEPIGLPIRNRALPLNRPAIVADAPGYVLAWTEWSRDERQLATLRLHHDGTRRDPEPVVVSTDPEMLGIVVAAQADDVLWLAWLSRADDQSVVRAVRMGPSGDLLDPAPRQLAWSSDDITDATLTAADDHVLAQWRTERGELHAAHVAPGTGQTHDDLARLVSPGRPAAAALGPHQYLVAYERLVPEAPFARERARWRVLDYRRGLGAGCIAHDECISGYCEDSGCAHAPDAGVVAEDAAVDPGRYPGAPLDSGSGGCSAGGASGARAGGGGAALLLVGFAAASSIRQRRSSSRRGSLSTVSNQHDPSNTDQAPLLRSRRWGGFVTSLENQSDSQEFGPMRVIPSVNPPSVHAVLAYARGELSGPAAAVVAEESIVTLAPDQLKDTVEALDSGVSLDEVVRTLGRPSTFGVHGLPRSRIF